MKISILELNYKTEKVLKALERNESVILLHHGKVRGIIEPAKEESLGKVKDHAFFGMNSRSERTVAEEQENLRKLRHD